MLAVRTRARICGTATAWSVEPNAGAAADGVECTVDLEIQGDDQAGYHLVMSPEGFFTADHWYQTRAEALASAEALFDGAAHSWT